MNPSPSIPSASLAQNLCDELRCFAPFAEMALADVEAFVLLARQSYYAPGETLLQPADGPVARLLFLRRGSVAGGRLCSHTDARRSQEKKDREDNNPICIDLHVEPPASLFQ